VTASSHEPGAPVLIVRVKSQDDLQGAIEQYISDLVARLPGRTIDVLGRYSHERTLVSPRAHADSRVSFRTVHSSKGLEADHVILPNLTTGTFGFPSRIEDDPILSLAMQEDDGFTHSEERRLFYVALTRARETVTIFTVKDRESPFVVELLCDPDVVLQDRSGDQEAVRACLKCEGGILQRRVSRYGAFYKCSRWPRCDYKEKPRPSSRVNDLARLGVER